MTSHKLKFIVVLLAVAALLAWWFFPRYSQEDKDYYVSVFCAIHHDESHRFMADMQTVIEGGNSDYALQKIHFKQGLANKVMDAWKTLTPEQQRLLKQDSAQCAPLLKPLMK